MRGNGMGAKNKMCRINIVLFPILVDSSTDKKENINLGTGDGHGVSFPCPSSTPTARSLINYFYF